MHRFFDLSPETVLSEILQNCRRAGATLVDITTKQFDNFTEYRITNNGATIEDPEVLVTLLRSGWGADTQQYEDPAGVGFMVLSASRGGATVESNDWRVQFTPGFFTRGDQVTPERVSEARKDTVVTMRIAPPKHLQNLLTFYPVNVNLNGIPQVTGNDYLGECEHVIQYPWGRVGILPHVRHYGQYGDNLGINFYGCQLNHMIPTISAGARMRVDLYDTRILGLTLPARTSVLQDERYPEFLKLLRKSMYEMIATAGIPHCLTFTNWKEAKEMGYDLPPAENRLRIKQPSVLWREFHEECRTSRTVFGKPEQIRFPTPTEESSYEAAILLLQMSTAQDIPELVFPDPDMEGYAWYDSMPALFASWQEAEHEDGITVVVDDMRRHPLMPCEPSKWEDSLGRYAQEYKPVRDAVLVLALCLENGNMIRREFKIPLAYQAYTYQSLNCNWVAVEGREVTVDNLWDLFSVESDSENDETDERFCADAAEQILLWEGDRHGAGEQRIKTALELCGVLTLMRRYGVESLRLTQHTIEGRQADYLKLEVGFEYGKEN
jgi:hypothetical protein